MKFAAAFQFHPDDPHDDSAEGFSGISAHGGKQTHSYPNVSHPLLGNTSTAPGPATYLQARSQSLVVLLPVGVSLHGICKTHKLSSALEGGGRTDAAGGSGSEGNSQRSGERGSTRGPGAKGGADQLGGGHPQQAAF